MNNPADGYTALDGVVFSSIEIQPRRSDRLVKYATGKFGKRVMH